jgi:ABC-type transporter Mla maintaining outer membrane lipid asymmetry permease subunit MlaE
MPPENQPSSFAASLSLYSARAVRGFSMLFTAIAGGVMTAQNLKDIGQPEAARKALWSSIAYTVAMIWLQTYVPISSNSGIFPIVVGYVGAMGLEAYSKKFIGNRVEFPAKRIVKPLLICLAIAVPLLALIFYSLFHPQA